MLSTPETFKKKDPAMEEYRVHVRDEIGRLVDFHKLSCRGDASAIELAGRDLQPGTCAEVWRALHYVARVRGPCRADLASTRDGHMGDRPGIHAA
jgi:hypothetical protein